MASVLGSASTGTVYDGVNDTDVVLTFSHTQSAGSNRILAVMLGYYHNGGGTITVTVTYGGTSMTQGVHINAHSNNRGGAIFYLAEASLPSDAAHNVVVTVSGTVAGDFKEIAAVAQHFQAVDQTTPFDGTVTGSGTGTTSSLTPSGSTGSDVAVDALTAYSGTPSITGGQTLIAEPAAPNGTRCSASREAGGGGAMSWSFASVNWTHCAGVVNDNAGGGGLGIPLAMYHRLRQAGA